MAEPSGEIERSLADFVERFDPRLAAFAQPDDGVPEVLAEAMRYALLAPGKRLRPFVSVRCCELAGGDFEAALPVAAAIEMVHAFSLIHDDLPAMDNDDLRRGQPTCHKQFGEAVAILAGDALLTLAFETVATCVRHAERGHRLTGELARGVGWSGIIGGQTADILGEQHHPDIDRVRFIHERKTAALYQAAARMGAVSTGASEEQIDILGGYGRQLGIAFQIADDLLDVTATAADMGKAVGKDAARRKQSYPACVGIEASLRSAAQAAEAAVQALARFGPQADDLRALARYVVARRR